jgi:hypothetical protein
VAQQDIYCRLAYEPSLREDRVSQSAYNYFLPINATLARDPKSSRLFFTETPG